MWLAIWILDLSFANVGQTFHGFGWENILLEAVFFAMFLGGRSTRPPLVVIYPVRWLEFRIIFGAGLIKLRGDPCWRFYIAPEWTHKAGVAFNYFSELIVPFFYFQPQPVASIAGVLTILFQSLSRSAAEIRARRTLRVPFRDSGVT